MRKNNFFSTFLCSWLRPSCNFFLKQVNRSKTNSIIYIHAGAPQKWDSKWPEKGIYLDKEAITLWKLIEQGVWAWGSEMVKEYKVCLYGLLGPQFPVISDKDTFYCPGTGKVPFTWQIYPWLPSGQRGVWSECYFYIGCFSSSLNNQYAKVSYVRMMYFEHLQTLH